jgi:hypothetical protein
MPRPMTAATRALLQRIVDNHGYCIGWDAREISRAGALKRRGYVTGPPHPGGRWSATEAGRAALEGVGNG